MSHAISWYASISSMHTGVDVISPDSDLSRYKVVFAPVQYVLSEKQAAHIRNYVENGGMFVTSFRLGAKDESSQIVRTPLPGLLRDVMGVTVKDYVPIYSEKIGVKFSGELAGADGECALWADLLTPRTARAVATYSGAYEGDAAITVNEFGKGKAVYIGADLDVMSLARVLRTLLAISGGKSDIDAPRGVEVTRRRAAGKEWFFLLNHTAQEQKVMIPGKYAAVVGGGPVDGSVAMKGFDVAVLQRA